MPNMILFKSSCRLFIFLLLMFYIPSHVKTTVMKTTVKFMISDLKITVCIRQRKNCLRLRKFASQVQ